MTRPPLPAPRRPTPAEITLDVLAASAAHRRACARPLPRQGKLGQHRPARPVCAGRHRDGGLRRTGGHARRFTPTLGSAARPTVPHRALRTGRRHRRPLRQRGVGPAAVGGQPLAGVGLARLVDPAAHRHAGGPAERLGAQHRRHLPHRRRAAGRRSAARHADHPPARGVDRRRDAVAIAAQRIEQGLGCAVRNSYGASEFLPIAWECDQGQLHVNADWVVLEPADAAWRPAIRQPVGASPDFTKRQTAAPAGSATLSPPCTTFPASTATATP